MAAATVLFLPGLLEDADAFRAQIDAIGPRATCVVADLTRSDSMAGLARDALAQAEAHAGPLSLVGHSMGSANALRLAIDHPQRVAALALLGAFAGFRDKPELEAFRQNGINQLVDPVDFEFARDFQASTLAQIGIE